VLSGLVALSAVPGAAFLPAPRTPLHGVDARAKVLCAALLCLGPARAPAAGRALSAAGLLTASLICLRPGRDGAPAAGAPAGPLPGVEGLAAPAPAPGLGASLLRRSLFLALLAFVGAALAGDAAPPPGLGRVPPAAIAEAAGGPELLGAAAGAASGYRYVLLNLGLFRVTRKSLGLACRAAAQMFLALQSAQLLLATTPPECVSAGLRWAATPLSALGAGAAAVLDELALSTLLALRFVSVCFEEVRALAVGLAVRGIQWERAGGTQAAALGRLAIRRLLSNLLRTAGHVAESMRLRGFRSPSDHRLHLPPGALPGLRARELLCLGVASALVAGGYAPWLQPGVAAF